MVDEAGSMSDDIEDILGPLSKPKKRGPGRPRGSKTKKPVPHPPLTPVIPTERRRPLAGTGTSQDIAGGVTIFWLAKAFGLEVSTVRKKLADCPPFARKTSGFTYSLVDAAPYLVRPRMNITEYLAEMDPRDLPQQLQGTYWDAQLKRNRFETQTRQMWETEDVLEVFSEVFKTIKFSLQLVPDQLERNTNLTDEQREQVQGSLDQLQDDIFQRIGKLSKDRSTPSAWERFLEREAARNQEEDIIVEDIL